MAEENPASSARSGVMSLNTIPGCGKSGTSRISERISSSESFVGMGLPPPRGQLAAPALRLRPGTLLLGPSCRAAGPSRSRPGRGRPGRSGPAPDGGGLEVLGDVAGPCPCPRGDRPPRRHRLEHRLGLALLGALPDRLEPRLPL